MSSGVYSRLWLAKVEPRIATSLTAICLKKIGATGDETVSEHRTTMLCSQRGDQRTVWFAFVDPRKKAILWSRPSASRCGPSPQAETRPIHRYTCRKRSTVSRRVHIGNLRRVRINGPIGWPNATQPYSALSGGERRRRLVAGPGDFCC